MESEFGSLEKLDFIVISKLICETRYSKFSGVLKFLVYNICFQIIIIFIIN